MIKPDNETTGRALFPHLIKGIIRGSKEYYLWLLFLALLMLTGCLAYLFQSRQGLIATGMRDPFSWGLYIANFAFFVGMAAAAIMIIIPAYIYHYQPLKEVCIIGEFLAASSIITVLLFVMVDLGRPDRFWHIIPLIGKFNFPGSLMTWDFLVLWGYLILNLIIPGYTLYCQYQDKPPRDRLLKPLIYLSIAWGISIHTVTAFIYSTLASIPAWHQAIIVPRFLTSAFIAGPCFLILALQVIRRYTPWPIEDKAINKLTEIVTFALGLNLFMLGIELLLESYSHTIHFVHREYLLFGLTGHSWYVIPTWLSITMQISALVLLLYPRWKCKSGLLNLSCMSAFIGVWLEKGLLLLASGFIPSPFGEVFEYKPTFPESMITVGVLAIGLFVFTLLVKSAIAIKIASTSYPQPDEGYLELIQDYLELVEKP